MLSELVADISKHYPQAKLEIIAPPEKVGNSVLLVDATHIYQTLEVLKNHPKYSFKVLQVISGVDFLEYMEVCYILATFDLHQSVEIIVKTRVTDRVNPTLPSVVPLYKSANWQERECYDMFGIHFSGHPDLRRILTSDDWQGYPLRKDYVAAKFYNGMEVFPDDKMNMEDRDFILKAPAHKDELIKKALAKGL